MGSVEIKSFVFYREEKVAIRLVKQPNNKVCKTRCRQKMLFIKHSFGKLGEGTVKQ